MTGMMNADSYAKKYWWIYPINDGDGHDGRRRVQSLFVMMMDTMGRRMMLMGVLYDRLMHGRMDG